MDGSIGIEEFYGGNIFWGLTEKNSAEMAELETNLSLDFSEFPYFTLELLFD